MPIDRHKKNENRFQFAVCIAVVLGVLVAGICGVAESSGIASWQFAAMAVGSLVTLYMAWNGAKFVVNWF